MRLMNLRSFVFGRLTACLALDSFWARELESAAANLQGIKVILASGELLDIDMLGELGPFPFKQDCFGMRPAMAFCLKSRRGGRHDPEQIKYSSARKVQSIFANYYHASKEQLEVIRFRKKSGINSHRARLPMECGTLDSKKGSTDCRMGDTLKQDLALSIGVILKLQENLEEDYQASSGAGWRIVVEAAAFLAETAYCIFRCEDSKC
jgi:hypothetical protein